MKSSLNDTNPEFEKIYYQHLRNMSLSDRFKQIEALTTFVRSLSKRAIAKANLEINLLFVKHHYGNDAYNKIKAYIEKRSAE